MQSRAAACDQSCSPAVAGCAIVRECSVHPGCQPLVRAAANQASLAASPSVPWTSRHKAPKELLLPRKCQRPLPPGLHHTLPATLRALSKETLGRRFAVGARPAARSWRPRGRARCRWPGHTPTRRCHPEAVSCRAAETTPRPGLAGQDPYSARADPLATRCSASHAESPRRAPRKGPMLLLRNQNSPRLELTVARRPNAAAHKFLLTTAGRSG
mmetsp:Transcript_69832/g.112647  ORF Transcript_69832/g.112647 Transcript_69832/m.112647 type:complete len:214 (-) Transcript_69832:579-1220(-)